MTKIHPMLLGAVLLLAGSLGCATVSEPGSETARATAIHSHHGHGDCAVQVGGLRICRGCPECRVDPSNQWNPLLAGSDREAIPCLTGVLLTWPRGRAVWHGRSVGVTVVAHAEESMDSPGYRSPDRVPPNQNEFRLETIKVLARKAVP